MTRQSYPPLRPQPPVRQRPRRPSWPLLVGIFVLVVLLALVALLLLNGPGNGGDPEGSPSADPATTAPSSSMSVAPSGLASATPDASPSADATTFAPDSLVTLAAEALTLRAEPGTDGEVLARLPAGQTAFVIAGPESANGLPWYYLSGMGLPHATGCGPQDPGTLLECPAWLGWVAAADEDGGAWVEAAAEPPACPTEPPTLVSVTELPYTMRLVCHDAADMTLRAFWPALPEGTAPEGTCPAAEAAIGWLVCQGINQNVIAADEAEGASGGGRLTVNILPGSDLAMPERGQWVDVTGHFDDPAAQQCADVSGLMATDPRELVFTCRLQFVLTAVAPAAAP